MSAEDELKKIDPKKHKKHAQFLLYSYCHYILEIYNRLSDKPDINFGVLIPLINNYILNLFIICLANQINLDATKGVIDEAVLIALDYISISNEDEFREQNYNPKFNDAIHFSYQKMHDRILAIIPNKPIASIITNLPAGMSLSTSPRSLPNNIGSPLVNTHDNLQSKQHQHHVSNVSGANPAGKSASIKRRLPSPGSTSALSNYISIISGAGNKTSRSIIFTAEILTRIFNIFAAKHGLDLDKYSRPHEQNNSTHMKHGRLNWLEIFEPIVPSILLDDLPDDDAPYSNSNSIFFTRLTYNLDILECFINMLLPQLLKLSQTLVGQLDMMRGQQIASDITQIYQRLTEHSTRGVVVPSFILMTMIYNYLHTCADNTDGNNILVGINNCCQIGSYLGYLAFANLDTENLASLSSSQTKYNNALRKLQGVLGISNTPNNKTTHMLHHNTPAHIHPKKINNKNLITAIITLNSYLVDV
jgi:hypothetical protein